jgi:hypothetical protein
MKNPNDEFKPRVERSGLTGLIFEELWNDGESWNDELQDSANLPDFKIDTTKETRADKLPWWKFWG